MRAAVVAFAAVLVLAGCFSLQSQRTVPQDYLTDKEYRTWVVEVDYSQGHRPPDALLSFLRDRLAPLVHKDALEMRVGDALATGSGAAWDPSSLPAFAAGHRDAQTGGGTVVTHLL